MNKILLTGGGTAGHIVPHLAIYPYLKNYFDKFYYVGSGKKIEYDLISQITDNIHTLNCPKLVRSFNFNNFLIPFQLIKSVSNAKRLLLQLQPDIIFSKGGYCSLPVCLAGSSLKIPIVCHESDLTMGLANKIAKNKCEKVLTTFLQTAIENGGEQVGSPMRDEIFNYSKALALKYFNVTNDLPILLVVGGSQGSKTLNLAVNNAIDKLCEKYNVIHLYGKNNPKPNPHKNYYPYEFCDMKYCYAVCDICVSRAGSNTLYELLYKRIPTLAVPLIKGSRGDQTKNAKYFADKNALKTADENYIIDNLYNEVNDLYNKKNYYVDNIKKLNIKNGSEKIAKILIDVAKNTKNK